MNPMTDDRRDLESSAPRGGEADARFRALADALPHFVWLARNDGAVEFVNRALLDATGLTSEEVLEHGWASAVHPDDLPRTVEVWAEARATEQPRCLDFRLRRRDGSYRWYAVSATPLRDDRGRVTGWLGSNVDVHESRVLAERFQSTLDSIHDGFVMLDEDGRVDFANSTARVLLGSDDVTVEGASVEDAYPVLARLLSRHVEELDPTLDAELQLSSGIWVEIRAHATSWHGRAIYIRDVSDRRRAELATMTSEERFRLLARATHDAVWDWDIVTNRIWWGQGYFHAFGIDPEAIVPELSTWTSRIHDDDRARVLDTLTRSVEARDEAWSAEYRFRRADGTYAHVVDRGYLLLDDGGTPIRMVGGMLDLTRRIETEARLREQAELLEAASDAILVRDLEGRVLYLNRRAEELYGWARDEAVGRDVRVMQFARTIESFEQANAEVLRRGEWSGELEQGTRDGRRLVTRGRWTQLAERDGRARSVLVINTDVTEEKERATQMARAQRLESIGTLAGGIAHDLNNVLLPILFSAELLLDDERDSERREDLSAIATAARRGAAMIRQLLAFARGSETHHTTVDLRSVVGEVVALIRETFPKSIAIEVVPTASACRVEGDATHLHQVLMNLCVNARDAMPDGGRLVIELQTLPADRVPEAREGTEVCAIVSVRDTGTGMTREVRERIFEPFFTTKAVGEGSGLGLSTSHALVRGHGGVITVESEVGVGSEFRVILPALDDDAPVRRPPSSMPSPTGGGEVVLVIDDEEPTRRLLARTLSRHGYRVLVACDGREGLATFLAHRSEVALVVTDMAMPTMDGPAFIRALREIDPSARVIGSSGLELPDPSLVTAFLPKPYTPDGVLKAIRAVLEP
jgi:PAS domain S-box-containing protein